MSELFATVGLEEVRERVPPLVFESMLLLRHAGRVDMAMKRFERWVRSVEGGDLPLDATALWLNSWLATYDKVVRQGRRPGGASGDVEEPWARAVWSGGFNKAAAAIGAGAAEAMAQADGAGGDGHEVVLVFGRLARSRAAPREGASTSLDT